MKRRKKRHFGLIVLLLMLLAAMVMLWLRLAPAIEELSASQVINEASDLIADAITMQMARDDISYESIVRLEQDGEGKLLALRTDMNELNRLRNETLSILNNQIEETGFSELGIPLGSIVLPTLFSGQGPELPIKVLTVRDADAEFTSRFQEAGVNQTLHQITLDVALNLTILTPAGTQTLRVDSGVVVAETVLMGQVPSTLINTSGFSDRNGEELWNQEAKSLP